MQCPSCGSDNRDGARFCNDCAAPLPLLCPSCGIENRPGAKFCNDCAAPLSTQPRSQVASSTFQVSSSYHPAPRTQHLAPVAYTPKHIAERTGFDREFSTLPPEQHRLFDYGRARLLFEADVFWATEAIGEEELASWLSVYQLSRDMVERGIVEVYFND
jgi:hypothetical protein